LLFAPSDQVRDRGAGYLTAIAGEVLRLKGLRARKAKAAGAELISR
jgi:hypothetical protein